MNDMYIKFRGYLSREFSVDYWSDVGIEIATEILAGFTDANWIDLQRECKDMPAEWRIRCAETIDSSPSNFVPLILLELLNDAEADVVVAAADALRCLDNVAIELSKNDFERISQLSIASSPVVRKILEIFLQKISII